MHRDLSTQTEMTLAATYLSCCRRQVIRWWCSQCHHL